MKKFDGFDFMLADERFSEDEITALAFHPRHIHVREKRTTVSSSMAATAPERQAVGT